MTQAEKKKLKLVKSGDASASRTNGEADDFPLRPRLSLSRLTVGLAFAFSLAVINHWTSGNIFHRYAHLQESIGALEAIPEGKAYAVDGEMKWFPMFHNRLIMPYAFRVLRQGLGVRPEPAYFILMLGAACLDYLLLCYLFSVRLGASDKLTAVALLVTCVTRLLTYGHGWEHASDVMEVSLVACYAILALEKRWLALLLVALLGSANRESSVFAGVLWVALYGLDEKGKIVPRALALGAALMVSCYAFVAALRIFTVGFAKWQGNQSQAFVLLENFREFFGKFTTVGGLIDLLHLAALWVPVLAWLWLNRETFGRREKRLLAGAVLVLGATLNFGLLFETRTLLAPLAVFLVAALCAEMKATPPQTLGRGYPIS